MTRLYWRIYLGFVGVVVLFALMVALFGAVAGPHRQREAFIEGAAATVAELLPVESSAGPDLERSLRRLSRRFRTFASVYSAEGALLARAGGPVPPPPDQGDSRWVSGPQGRAFALALPDGRWLVAAGGHRGRPAMRLLSRVWPWMLAALAVAIAIGAHPLARRITRRLERLQVRVEQLGRGDLSARVDVEGRDEVAELARSFNRAAQRIEALVDAQRSTLASASHELRSPLTRIRMALELLGDGRRPDLQAQVVRDIEELDELIEELLLASRLQAGGEMEAVTQVRLDVLVAEEAGRVGAATELAPASVSGSPKALRRMVRNLLENAQRHGRGAQMRARLQVLADGGLQLLVEDRGPGVPEELRERIFEPYFRPPGMREGEDRGVGLGLALVRQIARRHGGDATYEAREGGGSCFCVHLSPAG